MITVDESKCILPKIKIPDITKFHSVAFDKNIVTFCQYYDIGSGRSKILPQSEFIPKFSIQQSFSNVQHARREFTLKSISSAAVYFCSDNACSGSFDNEDDLIEHEQSASHIYLKDCPLSTNDRARHVFIEHLRGERLANEVLNQTAITSLINVNDDTTGTPIQPIRSQVIFSYKGYAIRRRQQATKITEKHHIFFKNLFQRGEKTGKNFSVEKAFDEMRAARNSDGSKWFIPDQYLNQKQIRGLFGRLTKQTTVSQTEGLTNVEGLNDINSSDSDSMTSDEEAAEDYLRQQQDQEQQLTLDEELNNALNLCSSSDKLGDSDRMGQD